MSSEDAENGPTQRQMHADELAREGRLEEALAEYLWCWDHGLEARPAYVGVRGSFLIGSLRELAKRHPAVLEALRARRDAAERRLLAAKATKPDAEGRNFPHDPLERAASDLAVLDDDFFGAPRRSLGVLERLIAAGEPCEAARRALAEQVVPLLCEERRYELIREARPDPVETLRRHLERMDVDFEALSRLPLPRRARILDATIGNVLPEYEALVASGRVEEAAALAELVLDADPRGDAAARLAERARRAGDARAAQELERLPGDRGIGARARHLLRIDLEELEATRSRAAKILTTPPSDGGAGLPAHDEFGSILEAARELAELDSRFRRPERTLELLAELDAAGRPLWFAAKALRTASSLANEGPGEKG